MRDFAKLKILEVSAISWQYFGWSLVYLQCCEFLVFGELFGSMSNWYEEVCYGVNECNWS